MSSIDRGKSDGPILPPELAELEAALRSFRAAPGRLDRERLMFELGRESTRHQTNAAARAPSVMSLSRLWPASTAALVLLSAGLVVAMVARPERIVVVERVVASNAVNAASAREPETNGARVNAGNVGHEIRVGREPANSMESRYFTQRQITVLQSVEALPSRPVASATSNAKADDDRSPLTARELWKTLSEENSNSPQTPAAEPDWLRWLNPETWL